MEAPRFQMVEDFRHADRRALPARSSPPTGSRSPASSSSWTPRATLYTYDINTNTNYNSAAEARAGKFGMRAVAAFLGASWSRWAVRRRGRLSRGPCGPSRIGRGSAPASSRTRSRPPRPVVLRGLVAQWPAVQQARESFESLAAYLAGFDNGFYVDAIRTPPSAHGRIFYNEDMSGFNFTREKVTISAALERMGKNAVREPAGARGAERADRRVPARFRREASDAAPRRVDRAAHLARQRGDHAGALRRVEQHRLRRGREAPLHAVSAGAGRAISISAPSATRRRARRSAWWNSRSPISSASRSFATRSRPRRSPRWSRATRSTSRRCGGTTSSRSTGATCW